MKSKLTIIALLLTVFMLASCGSSNQSPVSNMPNIPNMPNIDVTAQTCEVYKKVTAKYESNTSEDNGKLLNSPEYKQAKEFMAKNCK